MNSGIYGIFNLENGKVYIGLSSNIKMRWCVHKSLLRRGTHGNKHLQRAWDKYYEDGFEFRLLEGVAPDMLAVREGAWIQYYDSANPAKGYNLTTGGERPKASKETRARQSAALKGRVFSDEHRAKISMAKQGCKLSPAALRKLKVRANTPEWRAKMAARARGIKQSTKTIAKRVAKTTGKKRSLEVRARMSAAHKARHAAARAEKEAENG